jgi:hypothetical protein
MTKSRLNWRREGVRSLIHIANCTRLRIYCDVFAATMVAPYSGVDLCIKGINTLEIVMREVADEKGCALEIDEL